MKKQDKSRKKSLPGTSNGKNLFLNMSLIQDMLDDALAEAIKLYKSAAKRLGVKIDVEGCKSNLRDSDNLTVLKKAYESPENRQLLGAYVSARQALHSLHCRVEKAKILGGDMTQVDISHLLDSFRLLGVASYCIFDEHLQEDFADVRNADLKIARKVRHEPTIKMRNEANRLYELGEFKSKRQARYSLKGPLIDFAKGDDVKFVFMADNIEETIYQWLLYPEGKPKKKVAKKRKTIK